MAKKQPTKQFKEVKALLKIIFDSNKYQGIASYIKANYKVVAITCAFLWLVCYIIQYLYVSNKVTDHFTMVRGKIEEGSSKLNEIGKEFDKIGDYIESESDARYLADAYEYEFRRLQRQRLKESDAREEAEKSNKLRSALINNTDYPGKSKDLYELYREKYDIWRDIESYILSFRDSLMASQNMVPELEKQVAHIKSAGNNLNNELKASLEKREERLRNIAALLQEYDLNLSNQALARVAMEKNTDLLGGWLRESKEMIPLLVQYDSSDELIKNLAVMKQVADYLDIAKEIDWTVPMMVLQETKDMNINDPDGYMYGWYRGARDKYRECEETTYKILKCGSKGDSWPERIDGRSNSDCSAQARDKCEYLYPYVRKEKGKFIAMMNDKYMALGDNPGLKYAIFTQYRHKRYMNEDGYQASAVFHQINQASIDANKDAQAKELETSKNMTDQSVQEPHQPNMITDDGNKIKAEAVVDGVRHPHETNKEEIGQHATHPKIEEGRLENNLEETRGETLISKSVADPIGNVQEPMNNPSQSVMASSAAPTGHDPSKKNWIEEEVDKAGPKIHSST